jgi:hypothetical protein
MPFQASEIWAGAGLLAAALCEWLALGAPACAQEAASRAQRPSIAFNRWHEDWSVLADPKLQTQPFDSLKYIPLLADDPKSYMSFGLDWRERFESIDAPSFGVGHRPGDMYVLQRFQVHLVIHPNENWQIFTQFEDARALGKTSVTPVDEDKGDLEQAFVAYTRALAGGTFKMRVGRQEMGFDLQRFVAVRDGPNVRQAFDAVWLDWEKDDWRVIPFWSRPVQYRIGTFDDFSNEHFQYGGLRVERKDVGPGSLSAYYSRYLLDGASYLDAKGDEERDIFDVRYAGKLSGFDWDLEAMGQSGSVGDKTVRAWALGTLGGYTVQDMAWTPRLGLQFDAASGDAHPDSKVLGTFNPLFPNGYYFTLAGLTGYTNLIHLKPSVTVKPISSVTLLAAVGLQWRQTTADAVYVQPDIPVAGTAGKSGRWSGAYGQLRADWTITPQLSGAVEAVHYKVADVIRRAGGHDSDYLGVELKFGW